MAQLTKLESDNFETEALQSELPVLVDFSATWCGPCRALAPVVEELATEYSGRARIFSVDVDEAGDLATQYGVMSVPSLLFFKGGELVDRAVGALPKDELRSRLNRMLG